MTYVLSGCMLLIMWAESGCTKQSLDHRKREGHVHIALQWDKGYTPAGSRFYFYPEDGSEAIVRDCSKEGFSGTLPEGSYRNAHNSFLMHGFYRYHHLLLFRYEKKGEVIYYLGVPGNFHEQDRQGAVMFESFECAAEPAQEGDFGYFLMRTEL